MITVIFVVAALAWFSYRIFYQKKVLLWDWSEGEGVKYFWQNAVFKKEEDEYFGRKQ